MQTMRFHGVDESEQERSTLPFMVRTGCSSETQWVAHTIKTTHWLLHNMTKPIASMKTIDIFSALDYPSPRSISCVPIEKVAPWVGLIYLMLRSKADRSAGKRQLICPNIVRSQGYPVRGLVCFPLSHRFTDITGCQTSKELEEPYFTTHEMVWLRIPSN